MEIDVIQKELLKQVADLHEIPAGAYNIRANGELASRNTTANIDIVTKDDKSGIDIIIKPGTVNESVHIPVVLSQAGIKETVYNDFYIGENADVTIIAGCGIHNGGKEGAEHSGIHRFFLKENAKVKYIEKHYGSGDGTGERVMNPTTEMYLEKGSSMEMETTQIKGIDSTNRFSKAVLGEDASLIIKEKIMTHGKQSATTDFVVEMNGDNSHVNLISRSVARDHSKQLFVSKIIGNNPCTGHSECDAIIMDQAEVSARPELTAKHIDAQLIHEAAIGKIAGEQLMKLMTLGLSEAEAEEQIVNGFLK